MSDLVGDNAELLAGAGQEAYTLLKFMTFVQGSGVESFVNHTAAKVVYNKMMAVCD